MPPSVDRTRLSRKSSVLGTDPMHTTTKRAGSQTCCELAGAVHVHHRSGVLRESTEMLQSKLEAARAGTYMSQHVTTTRMDVSHPQYAQLPQIYPILRVQT